MWCKPRHSQLTPQIMELIKIPWKLTFSWGPLSKQYVPSNSTLQILLLCNILPFLSRGPIKHCLQSPNNFSEIPPLLRIRTYINRISHTTSLLYPSRLSRTLIKNCKKPRYISMLHVFLLACIKKSVICPLNFWKNVSSCSNSSQRIRIDLIWFRFVTRKTKINPTTSSSHMFGTHTGEALKRVGGSNWRTPKLTILL